MRSADRVAAGVAALGVWLVRFLTPTVVGYRRAMRRSGRVGHANRVALAAFGVTVVGVGVVLIVALAIELQVDDNVRV